MDANSATEHEALRRTIQICVDSSRVADDSLKEELVKTAKKANEILAEKLDKIKNS